MRRGAWEHPSLAQLWGPRFHDYVVAAVDVPVFSLGRLPDATRARARALDTATRLHAHLDGRRLPFGEAGRGMGVSPNSLRYAAQTGTVRLRWDGARQPVVWTVPPPDVDPAHARRELARRHFHVFAPSTVAAFARWAGVSQRDAAAAVAALAPELLAVRTPIGEGWILRDDEAAFRTRPAPPASARLLPSGDAYTLAWGPDRTLLVPDARRRALLWTTRVWPGALLVGGEVAGTWRRTGAEVTLDCWRRLDRAERAAVDAEIASLPL